VTSVAHPFSFNDRVKFERFHVWLKEWAPAALVLAQTFIDTNCQLE